MYWQVEKQLQVVANSRRWYLKRDVKRIVKGTVLISRRSVNCKLKVSNGQARGSACFVPKKPVLRAFKLIHLSEATRQYGSYFVGCGTEFLVMLSECEVWPCAQASCSRQW